MRCLAFLMGALSLGVLVSQGTSGPVTGLKLMPRERIEARSALQLQEKFKGGQRACVIVEGDHQPVVPLGIQVFDSQNNLVAEDKGGGDFVSAIWYPPRDDLYVIKIANSGNEYNICYIVLK